MKYIFLAKTYFCCPYITEEEIINLKRLLSCGALERSNSPYIESIVEPCVSKNEKKIFAMWF